MQRTENHTVSDYETLAELEYAFIVWRTNLKRDLSLTEDREVCASCFMKCLLRSLHALARCPCGRNRLCDLPLGVMMSFVCSRAYQNTYDSPATAELDTLQNLPCLQSYDTIVCMSCKCRYTHDAPCLSACLSA